MPIISIIILVFVVGFSVFNSVVHKNASSSPAAEVQGEATDSAEIASSSAALIPSSSSFSSPSPQKVSSSPTVTKKSDSNISISVDAPGTKPASDKLIYPGATGSGNSYETSSSGESVYDWYKSEMQKRSYQIRNNVKTKANDKFKAVLQGVSDDVSLKVTIDQENSGAKTKITFE